MARHETTVSRTPEWAERGRIDQKRRTHAALVGAAAELMAEGVRPTIALAAERTGISRATAYRYFSSNRALATEAATELAFAQDLKFKAPTGRPELDVDNLVRAVFTFVSSHEGQVRDLMRVLWDPTAQASRAGRRLSWVNEALEGLDEISGPERERLVAGLALLTGPEALVVLKDVCGLDDAEAKSVARWAAQAMLAAARQGSS